MRKLTVTALLFGVLISPPAATAGAPATERSTVERHFDDFYVCNGFNVIGDFTVRRTAMEFPDRFVIHRDIEGTLSNSVTGATLPSASTTSSRSSRTGASRSPARRSTSLFRVRERSS